FGGKLRRLHMSIQATTQLDRGATHGSLPVPAAAMDNLAARARPAGLFVMLLRPNGSVAYHDESSSVFFQRFVLPLAGARDPELAGRSASLETHSRTPQVGLVP